MERRHEEIAVDLVVSGLAERAKMFGMPSLKAKARGTAIGGFFNGDVVLKPTDETSRSAALALGGEHLFEPMAGRPMKESVQVPAAHCATL